MTTDFALVYPIIGVTVGFLVLGACVIGVYQSADDGTDLVMGVMVSMCAASIAGLVWPATLLAGLICTPWLIHEVREWRDDCRRDREREREHRQREQRASESDTAKFQRLAREQRNLATQARRDGQDELAALQDSLAEQYEQTARMYAKET